ncbi:allophanate hydrolase [Tolumonas osonensis]|uniref:Allophanate hydrolase n=1 Tax=Tolumonas osonensis TaxID=675874 RepID=A0A841GC29_9GAMM|nr:allophanate hydrolase [Tolumonas osonensis]MBB6056718.1 allophanate hydrolase [Tolumonas osonensis]
MMTTMTISAIHAAYRSGELTPQQLLSDCLQQAQQDQRHVWISLLSAEQLNNYLKGLEGHSPDDLPLFGIPFAIKDNIDLADLPTTAACPDYSYQPPASAFVVQQLIAAGAIPLGKTNLDQFATGLVGVRSPYGACQNSLDPAYISGGSSSGSAVAVATGQVCFALGTDTAGSGRVPAAFNNILGLKGTKGRISCTGVVPACKSLDCVTIFAQTAADLAAVWPIAAQFDPQDPFAREALPAKAIPAAFRFGVPAKEQLKFFGDDAAEVLFWQSVQTLEALGGTAVTVNLEPFLQAARLLYEGPWVAERLAAIKDFFRADPGRCLPVIQTIVGGAESRSAVDAYEALYELQRLKRIADAELAKVDLIVTPTTGTIYKIEAVLDDQIRLNSNLGYYTNFMNLLDYSAIALPSGFRAGGEKQDLPFGITLFARAFQDEVLLALGDQWQRQLTLPLGASHQPLPVNTPEVVMPQANTIDVVVCGAHLSGLPLNGQLTERRAVLVQTTTTAKAYRMYALAGGPPYRPGLIRDEQAGQTIAVEVWRVPADHFGSFVAGIPAPLGIGKVQLADGDWVSGFICEPYGITGAEEITALGGWRHYLNRNTSPGICSVATEAGTSATP